MALFPLFSLVSASFLFVGCASSGFQTSEEGKELAILERRVFLLVNKYRQSKGLAELAVHEALQKEARNHSSNMALGIVSVGHDGFTERVGAIERKIRYRSAAENVGFNQGYEDPVQVAVEGWLKSKEHRENIEGAFNLTGIGVAKVGSDTFYFTQIFILTG